MVTVKWTRLATWPQKACATESSVRVVSGVVNLAVEARQNSSLLRHTESYNLSKLGARRAGYSRPREVRWRDLFAATDSFTSLTCGARKVSAICHCKLSVSRRLGAFALC